VNRHPVRVQALEESSDEVRISGVEALHSLAADTNDELRCWCAERDAVAQDAISGHRDSLPHDGDARRLGSASHRALTVPACAADLPLTVASNGGPRALAARARDLVAQMWAGWEFAFAREPSIPSGDVAYANSPRPVPQRHFLLCLPCAHGLSRESGLRVTGWAMVSPGA
jgi:hypothetical protein